MNAMAPCPSDSALMKAWEAHQATEEYANSLKWAVQYIPRDDPEELERAWATGANPFTYRMKLQAAEGSLWALFSAGWKAAGGVDPFKKAPTIADLEAILNQSEVPIEVLPNGSVRVLHGPQ